MDKRDNLGEAIKNIMEKETFDLTLSQGTLDNIFKSRKKTMKEKISDFLNREIIVPMAPITLGIIALSVIAIIPSGSLESYEERNINIEGSQVIIRERYEVTRHEDES